jgi:hypothetical protein
MGRIVVVAPTFRATEALRPSSQHVYAPVIDPRQTYTSTAGTNFTNLVAQVREQPTYREVFYDPMISELAWRLPFEEEAKAQQIRNERNIWLMDGQLRARFWDKQEFTDWIETNLKGDVLVQIHMELGWNICCVLPEDHESLGAHLVKPKRHRVEVTFETPEDLAIIEAWVAENVRGQTVRWTTTMPDATRPGRYLLLIRDQKEAVHMRLRFSEVVREAQEEREESA